KATEIRRGDFRLGSTTGRQPEELGQPGPALGNMASTEPELANGICKTKTGTDFACLNRRAQRRAKVVVLAGEGGQRFTATAIPSRVEIWRETLREVHKICHGTATDHWLGARAFEALLGVLAYRLQHPIARGLTVHVDSHQ